ncbi:hypothetical protein Taro_015362 [Colocasia esculenta]|uniref:Ribosomal RNA-processing protein 17 n=1 Tax=Colocasia esculenta TaxID=4460 RepID=A0A843UPN3_COLES|nr:hypothetical protein [Colocasia esculenta]
MKVVPHDILYELQLESHQMKEKEKALVDPECAEPPPAATSLVRHHLRRRRLGPLRGAPLWASADWSSPFGWASSSTSMAEVKLNYPQNHPGEENSELPEDMEAEEEGEGRGEGAAALGLIPATPTVRGRHVNKRALKNKGLSVGFDEKDLKDFVTGFHKRKKKRRKIAQKQLQEKERLQRIEARKKRKLEREIALYGGALPAEEYPETGSGNKEDEDDLEHGDLGKTQFVSGTKTYESNGMSITVTTSELSREEENLSVKHHIPKLSAEVEKSRHLPPKKQPFKKASKQRSHHKKHKKPAFKGKGEKKGRRR